MISPSLLLLMLACIVYAVVHGLRAGKALRLKSAVLGAAVLLVTALVAGAVWFPTSGSYPNAENMRVVRAAVDNAQREAAQADCVVIVDGSSVFAHAVDDDVLHSELTKAGLHPCVLSLVLLGGEHLEREWMARRLRAALPIETTRRLDGLPMIWVKEMHWTYESHPARFVAANANSQRTLAFCQPEMAVLVLRALHDNWKGDCRSDKLAGAAAWRAYPWPQVTAVAQQSVYNLFHVGQMQRLMELDPGPLYHVLGEGRLAPDTTPKPWWNERPDVDEKFIPLSRYRERKWFEQLLRSAPSTWPRRPGFELVMATMHGQNRFVQGYNATLAANGLIGGEKLLVASADAELRRQLNDISLWQDHIHLENTGAVVYTRWLSAQLLPMLSELKQQAPTVEVRH